MSEKNLINVIINGEEKTIAVKNSLFNVINENMHEEKIPFVISVNGNHVPKENLISYKLLAGDKVEILTLRQGG